MPKPISSATSALPTSSVAAAMSQRAEQPQALTQAQKGKIFEQAFAWLNADDGKHLAERMPDFNKVTTAINSGLNEVELSSDAGFTFPLVDGLEVTHAHGVEQWAQTLSDRQQALREIGIAIGDFEARHFTVAVTADAMMQQHALLKTDRPIDTKALRGTTQIDQNVKHLIELRLERAQILGLLAQAELEVDRNHMLAQANMI
jgi:hypothetical protein